MKFSTPEEAFEYAKHNGRYQEAETIILTSPRWSYLYALHVLKDRWVEAEPIIATEAESAYYYAHDLIKGAFPEAENVLASNEAYSCAYACEVIKSRFHKAEPILVNSHWGFIYTGRLNLTRNKECTGFEEIN